MFMTQNDQMFRLTRKTMIKFNRLGSHRTIEKQEFLKCYQFQLPSHRLIRSDIFKL